MSARSDLATAPDARQAQPLRFRIESVDPKVPNQCTGRLLSGSIRAGDLVFSAPGRRGPLTVRTTAPHTPAIDELSILEFWENAELLPGDLLAPGDDAPLAADQFQADIIWSGTEAMLVGRKYHLGLGPVRVAATVTAIRSRSDPNDKGLSSVKRLETGQAGAIGLATERAIAFDPAKRNAATGRCAIYDLDSGRLAGMCELSGGVAEANDLHFQVLSINKGARARRMGQKPCVIWFTGLSGAGKSTIANLVESRLHQLNHHTYLLDGDNVRHGLNKDLGFSDADRVENIRRVAEVAKMMVDAGLIALVSFISPFRSERRMARALLDADEFIEVFVDTPLSVAESRDPKGLYKKARSGQLKNFTGLDSPYEPPEHPELRVQTVAVSPAAAAEVIVQYLKERGFLPDNHRLPQEP